MSKEIDDNCKINCDSEFPLQKHVPLLFQLDLQQLELHTSLAEEGLPESTKYAQKRWVCQEVITTLHTHQYFYM